MENEKALHREIFSRIGKKRIDYKVYSKYTSVHVIF